MVRHALSLIDGDQVRLRLTLTDNAPAGREVHEFRLGVGDRGRRPGAARRRAPAKKEKGRFAIGLSKDAELFDYALTFESPVSRASSTGAGRSTSSTSAIGALSPWRKPNLRMRR